jgi:hypothetical protein
MGCFISIALAHAQAGDVDAPLLTAGEGRDVDAVLEQAITLGFPEVRSARWHESNGSGFYPIADLELPGGGWLLGLWRSMPRQWKTTPLTDLKSISDHLRIQPPTELVASILRLDPAASARLARTTDASLNGHLSDELPGWGWSYHPNLALPGAVLRRCSASSLGDRYLLQAQYNRTRAEYGLCFTEDEIKQNGGYETPGPRWNVRLGHLLWFNYENCDRWRDAEWKRSAVAPGTMPLLPLTTVLRHDLHLWFRQCLMESDSSHAQAWADSALSILDPADRDGVRLDIEALRLRTGITEPPPADAPLTNRLAAWDAGPFSVNENSPFYDWDRFTVLSPEEYRRQFGANGTEHLRYKHRYDGWLIFQSFKNQADGLVELLDSDKPCRWLEDETPRTLGDNALRALTVLWNVDPRILVGRSRFAAWDDQERHATAQAVQDFWRTHRQRPILDAILEDVTRLSPWTLLRISEAGPRDDQQRIAASLASSWKLGPPPPRDRQEKNDLEALLQLICADPTMSSTIRNWPIQGEQAREMLYLHERAGDPAPLEGYLTRLIEGNPTADDKRMQEVNGVEFDFEMIIRHSNLKRSRLMLTALSLPTTSPMLATAFPLAIEGLEGHGPRADDWILNEPSGIDVTGLLVWRLLGDQRPAPAELADKTIKRLGPDIAGSAIAPDLRLCDLVLASITESISANEKDHADKLRRFLTGPRSERDEVIAKRKVINEVQAKTIAAALGGGADTFKQWGLSSPASDF